MITTSPGPGVTSMTTPAATTVPPTSPTVISNVLRRMKWSIATSLDTPPCWHVQLCYGAQFSPGSGVTPAEASVDQQFGRDSGRGCHHRGGRRRAPVVTAHGRSRLGRDQGPGGHVPRLQAGLEVAVEAAARDQAQVEGGGPQSADVAHRGQQAGEGERLLRPAGGPVGEPGTDQRRLQGGGAGDRDRHAVAHRPTVAPHGPVDLPVAGIGDHPDLDHAVDLDARSTPPTPGGRTGSWWCRRGGRSPTARRSCPAGTPLPRPGWRRGAGRRVCRTRSAPPTPDRRRSPGRWPWSWCRRRGSGGCAPPRGGSTPAGPGRGPVRAVPGGRATAPRPEPSRPATGGRATICHRTGHGFGVPTDHRTDHRTGRRSTCGRTPSPGRPPRCAGPWPRPRWATTSTARTRRSTPSRTPTPSGWARRRRCSSPRG